MRRSWAIVFLGLVLAASNSWPRERHFSFWSDDPQPFLDAIKRSAGAPVPELPAGSRVCGGVVTHHFLASGLMVRFFGGLKGHVSPETIVLLGPNHFHQGLADISISSLPWETPFGVLETDRRLVQQIGRAIRLREDPEAFSGEHSVGVLIPFLKYYFPQSRVVPILIDVNAEPTRLRKLREVLSAQMANPGTLVILSMDFSHDSRTAIADVRDEHAQKVISAMNADETSDLHVDCPKGLRLLLEALKDQACDSVKITEHTNSGRLVGQKDLSNVTSYFTIYFLN